MKVLLIADACAWNSWPEKIAAIKAFYTPLVELDIDILHTDFADIPLKSYPGTVTQFTATGPIDVPGNDLEIDLDWFSANVAPLIAGYDIAIFQAANVRADGLPLGIKFEDLNGTWCCETFVPDEGYTYTLPPLPGQASGISLGNEAEIVISHEIAHALYSISGQPDRTHQFFYANQFPRVLTDILLPSASPLEKLYHELIALLTKERDEIMSQKSAADMNTKAAPAFPVMITKWIAAIGKAEGANSKYHNRGNLKYSSLTASWGATRAFQATDGGWIAAFPNDQIGDTALGNFLVLGCENELLAFHSPAARTLNGFTRIFAGNPKPDYYDVIHAGLGVPGDTQISTFLA